MKKIKVMEYTDRWTTGGIEKYIVSLTAKLDKHLFQPFIITAQKEADLFDADLAKYGLQVQPLLTGIYDNPFKRISNTWASFYRFVKREKPDILHLHICQGVGLVYACLAKWAGVRTVVTHSHNSDCGYQHRLLKLAGHYLCRFILQKKADIRLACSDLAGKWLYGEDKQFKTVKIPVDIDRFQFNEKTREQIRRRKGLEDECVMLNIGRMGEQKNQLYLIDLFYFLQKECHAMLYIIGNGELERDIRRKIQEYSLEDKVVIIDHTSKVEEYLWMADVFVLPSLYEGNPVVLIEAQASGLGCVYSDTITGMAKINKNVAAVSLNADKQIWTDKIMEMSGMEMERSRGCQNVKDQGYSMEQIIHEMQEIYSGAM